MLRTAGVPHERGGEPAVGGDGLMLGETLRAEAAAVHGMLGVTLDADGDAVADADQHPAAHRAVAARRAHPVLGLTGRSHGAEPGIGAVAVVGDHSWLPKKDPAADIGTTVT